MRSAASMDAMRLLNPRLLRQAGSARGYLAVTVALGLAGAVLILFQADLLSRALAGAARGTGIAALSGVLAWLVRALSAGRGVSRYLERLASHDAAFRVLARVRVRIYRRLERLAPAGLAAFSSGDLLARLVSDPDLLILDEPTAHLDPGTRRALLSDVLAATAGRMMLLITHDLDGLDEFDQVITLESGKIADVYLLRDPGNGSAATRCPARLRGAHCIPAGGPDRAARFT